MIPTRIYLLFLIRVSIHWRLTSFILLMQLYIRWLVIFTIIWLLFPRLFSFHFIRTIAILAIFPFFSSSFIWFKVLIFIISLCVISIWFISDKKCLIISDDTITVSLVNYTCILCVAWVTSLFCIIISISIQKSIGFILKFKLFLLLLF